MKKTLNIKYYFLPIFSFQHETIYVAEKSTLEATRQELAAVLVKYERSHEKVSVIDAIVLLVQSYLTEGRISIRKCKSLSNVIHWALNVCYVVVAMW